MYKINSSFESPLKKYQKLANSFKDGDKREELGKRADRGRDKRRTGAKPADKMTKNIFDMVDPSSLQEKCDIRISHFRRNNPPFSMVRRR